MHNEIFPDTFYRLYAFTGFEGRTIMPVLKQDFVKDAEPTPQIAIDTYMAALGFTRLEQTGRYARSTSGCLPLGDERRRLPEQEGKNDTYTVWDLIPRNVLRDRDGDIYVVNAEIKRNK